MASAERLRNVRVGNPPRWNPGFHRQMRRGVSSGPSNPTATRYGSLRPTPPAGNAKRARAIPSRRAARRRPTGAPLILPGARGADRHHHLSDRPDDLAEPPRQGLRR